MKIKTRANVNTLSQNIAKKVSNPYFQKISMQQAVIMNVAKKKLL